MSAFKMSVQQVNYLNIGLMLISAVSALLFPFETFLFVYAFLGPLHYLTEISWLHDRNYFTKRRFDWIPLLGIGVVVSLLYFELIPRFHVPLIKDGLSLEHFVSGQFLTYFAFVAALVFATVKKWSVRSACLVAACAAVLLFGKTAFYDSLFGQFLPTLVHVFIFTALFILVGALKGRDRSGILSLLAFVACTALFVFYHPDRSGYHPHEYVRQSYGVLESDQQFTRGGFISLNHIFMQVFRIDSFRPTVPMNQADFIAAFNSFLYSNAVAVSVMSFIAFAYMYHYLNWFSKTSVIQWHNISRARFAGVIALWIASVGIYLYDYRMGLKWLFFLSFTHVLLEFPLNHLTFINIGKEMWDIVKSGGRFRRVAPVPALATAAAAAPHASGSVTAAAMRRQRVNARNRAASAPRPRRRSTEKSR